MAEALPIVRGTLDLLILRALRWEPTHGAGVVKWIRYVTAGAIEVDEGSLYPALHRQWFWAEQERWERYKEVVDRVLRYGTAAGILGR
jgi:hypothetical protein